MNKRPARIVAKMNSLCDADIIKALYEAAAQGVKIQLIVRGICCLMTGVEGTKNNIEVRSIVGNFLEHARIFYFENSGNSEIYMASADWMPRNLERRVEIMFPVLNSELKEKVYHVLEVQLADNEKAQLLQPDGSYEKIDADGEEPRNAQDEFCKEYVRQAKSLEKEKQSARTFKPEYKE
jgi:polyphosphate kinase